MQYYINIIHCGFNSVYTIKSTMNNILVYIYILTVIYENIVLLVSLIIIIIKLTSNTIFSYITVKIYIYILICINNNFAFTNAFL